MLRFFAGVVATLVAIAAVVFVAVWFGFVPARADVPPPALEKWAARQSLNATLAREAPPPPYPFGPVTDATIVSGAKLYMASCSGCHGSGVGDPSLASRGFYIEAPQFKRHGVADDPPGETYWKLEHGIRFTAMPAFGGLLTEQQIWQITYFLGRGTDKLPPAAAQIWNQPHDD